MSKLEKAGNHSTVWPDSGVAPKVGGSGCFARDAFAATKSEFYRDVEHTERRQRLGPNHSTRARHRSGGTIQIPWDANRRSEERRVGKERKSSGALAHTSRLLR